MANHYQPLLRLVVDGKSAPVLSDEFVRELCAVHRPTTRALFDRLAPLCSATEPALAQRRWCAAATVVEHDGGPPTPMQRKDGNLLDVASLDTELLAALERRKSAVVHSLLPIHEPSVECVAALAEQVCRASANVLSDVLVASGDKRVAARCRPIDEMWVGNNAFAVLVRVAPDDEDENGDHHWLAAHVQPPRVRWCSSRDAVVSTFSAAWQSGKQRRRGRSRTQSAAADIEALERTVLIDALRLRDDHLAGVTWERERSAAVDICRARDAPLWAVSLLWRWLFGARGVTRARIDGSTRLGCAIALARPTHYCLDKNRPPPLRGASAATMQHWLAGWRELTEAGAQQRAVESVQLTEESGF